MAEKRFRGLTPKQQEAFEQIACGWSGGSEKHPAMMAALERRGLVEGEDVESRENGMILTFRQYRVPIPVHMEWCGWCAEHYPEEAL